MSIPVFFAGAVVVVRISVFYTIAIVGIMFNLLVKRLCAAINLPGNYGSHTLRKTFGFILRRKFGVGWEFLARRYNHSSPSVTRAYLGIQNDEVDGILIRCAIWGEAASKNMPIRESDTRSILAGYDGRK